jgi:pimeloyl-[acyl-carrier protein] synthase
MEICPTGIQPLSSKLRDAEYIFNPYPYYRELRVSGEPVWVPPDPDVDSRGILLFPRYTDAKQIFRLSRAVTKDLPRFRHACTTSLFDINMMNRDGEEHLRLRRLVSSYFSSVNLRELEPRIETMAEVLLDQLERKGPDVDLVSDYAELLPLNVILGLLGIPSEDAQMLRAWSLAATPAMDTFLACDESLIQAKMTAFKNFVSYVQDLIRNPNGLPKTGMLNYLLDAGSRGEISTEEIAGMTLFLVFAGHETTISLISNGLWLLLSHPDQLRLLKEQPQLASCAVEEVLRLESPTQRSTFRMVTAPANIGGFELEPGFQVSALIGSANRDESVFADPERFDIGRTPNRHLAFGAGLHNCLGKNLARMEAHIAFARIFDRFPGLRLRQARPCWRRNTFFRGLASLPAEIRSSE